MGNNELLHQLGGQRLALPEGREYLTFFVTCTDSTKSFRDLLQLLVNSAESVEQVGSQKGADLLVDRTTRRKLTLKVVEVESTKKYEAERGRQTYQDLNLEEKLVELCHLLNVAYGQPILFIIDELDRMKSTIGLASFLKAVSSEQLKFVLVGIASNVSDLLSDHLSLERKLLPVHVPLMDADELGQIVQKAQSYLRSESIAIAFSHRAVSRLVEVASGFPWFVHMLGQQCLIEADTLSRGLVQHNHVDQAIRGVVDNRLAQHFSDMYQAAVRDSEPRERVLRAFAHWTAADIPTGEVYRILSQDLGVAKGSTYRGHLCKAEYGSILFVPAIQKRGLVRFRNEMFKTYVRLRPSIYSDVDADVANAYKLRQWRHERDYDEYTDER